MNRAASALRSAASSLIAPLLSLLIAGAVSAAILLIVGLSPALTFSTMIAFGTQPDSLVSAVNRAVVYFLAGGAVAVTFRMNLFNIGVDGQYRIAALAAAAVGAAVTLPAPLHLAVIIGTAMAAGALWAGIAALLKVWRGVNEVLSTLLLNYVATALSAFALAELLTTDSVSGSTTDIAPSGRILSLNGALGFLGLRADGGAQLGGSIVIAVIVGLGLYLLLYRSWYGLDLRATGLSPGVAAQAGTSPTRMIVVTMLVSGAIAGLVGMPHLLGTDYHYGFSFPTGLGFTGIAVALIGRNSPVGIAIAALLFGFMERSALVLELDGIPKEIVTIMQGVLVIAVVMAYEVVRRSRVRSSIRSARSQIVDGISERSVA